MEQYQVGNTVCPRGGSCNEFIVMEVYDNGTMLIVSTGSYSARHMVQQVNYELQRVGNNWMGYRSPYQQREYLSMCSRLDMDPIPFSNTWQSFIDYYHAEKQLAEMIERETAVPDNSQFSMKPWT